MKLDKLGSIIGFAGTIISFILAVIKEALGGENQLFNTVFWISIGFILLVVLGLAIAIVVSLLKERKRATNLVDNASIYNRSRAIAKGLKKVVKKIDKTIEKRVKNSPDRDNHIKDAIANINLLVGVKKNRIEKVKRNISYFEELRARKVKNDIKASELNDIKIFELNEAVLKSIKEMSRALLVLSQYDTRIYLGDYVLEHSSDVFDRADALIDLKGWTYSLVGNISKFKKSVHEGIQLLEDYLKTETVTPEDVTKANLKLARAYRHLGSDVASAKKKPKEARETNEKAEAIIKERFTDGQLNQNEKACEMHVGIKYGELNAKYFELKSKIKDKKKAIRKDDIVSESLDNIKELREYREKAATFKNKHRFVKIVLLENEFIKLLEINSGEELKQENKDKIKTIFGIKDNYRQSFFEVFSNNTREIDDIYKNEIYADEVMETYIGQEVDELFAKIKEIAN